MSFTKELINSQELDRIKFGVYLVRKQMTIEDNEPSYEMLLNNMPELLLTTLEKNLNNDSISVKLFNIV
jgi:hypothetical protein